MWLELRCLSPRQATLSWHEQEFTGMELAVGVFSLERQSSGSPMSDTVPAPETPAKPNELVEIIRTVFWALLIALFLRVLLFQPFTIPSASMEPNLFEGDY